MEYFDEQDRLTRVCLTGVGITCGFRVEFDATAREITIYQGCGITTDGDLIKLQKYENKIIVMEDQSYIINEVNTDTISITIANKENKNDVMEKKFGSIDDMEKELKSLNYE